MSVNFVCSIKRQKHISRPITQFRQHNFTLMTAKMNTASSPTAERQRLTVTAHFIHVAKIYWSSFKFSQITIMLSFFHLKNKLQQKGHLNRNRKGNGSKMAIETEKKMQRIKKALQALEMERKRKRTKKSNWNAKRRETVKTKAIEVEENHIPETCDVIVADRRQWVKVALTRRG